jgi:hypothetical protein
MARGTGPAPAKGPSKWVPPDWVRVVKDGAG